MECISYKGGCSECGHCMGIKVLKEQLAGATSKQLELLAIIYNFKPWYHWGTKEYT